MNMPVHIPLPLQLSQPQRFTVPPILRRALLCCVVALVGALLLWALSDTWYARACAKRDTARADTQKTAMQLASAIDTRSAQAARAKRFALVKAALENALPSKAEWEQLIKQLSTHPHIVDPTLEALPGQDEFPAPKNQPAITFQSVHIQAGLLHEEALLTLDAITGNFPTHHIPMGCSLWREADAAPITLRARCEFGRAALMPPLE